MVPAMFRIRPFAALPLLALPLLASCSALTETAQPAPEAPRAPSITEATLKQTEQNAYWRGFAAGRHYQLEKDAHAAPADLTPATPDTPTASTAPGTTPATGAAPATTATTAAASPPPPSPPSPPRPGSLYRPSGVAQPLGN